MKKKENKHFTAFINIEEDSQLHCQIGVAKSQTIVSFPCVVIKIIIITTTNNTPGISI